MGTRIGFYLFAGLLIGLVTAHILFYAAGWGAIVGALIGLGLGIWQDKRTEDDKSAEG